jgi:hypothetical protein
MSNSTWIRFLTEGLVIIASILVAFGIDAWWQGRQEEGDRAAVLEAVRAEAMESRRELDTFIERTTVDMDRADRFFRASASELAAMPPDSVNPWIRATVVPWTYDTDVSAAAVLLDDPSTSAARGDTRLRVAAWVRSLEDAREEKEALTFEGNAMLRRLASASPETASGGLDFLDAMATRAGPGLLARLRNDDAYVAGTMAKTHLQAIYLGEMIVASEALDSVLASLAPTAGG